MVGGGSKCIDSRDDLEIYVWKKTKTLEEMTILK